MQSKMLTASALVAGASAANYLGFNSGSTHGSGAAKVQSDFEAEFKTAQNLAGAPGDFNAVRLYTNIQGASTSDPIEAFPAAIATKTSLLLGIWTSGTDSIDNEINALKAGLETHGDDLANLIIGVSIGSEDLYRAGATGVENDAGIGAGPDAIVNFIKEFKNEFSKYDFKIGHVDTWDAWTNGSNSAVIDAVDWLGVDEYPYYQTGDDNTIDNAASLFKEAYDNVVKVAGGKDVWVTETGWPYEGPDWDKAVPSVANAKQFWDEVGCDQLFGKVPTFWYNLVDDSQTNEMSFAITKDLNTDALFNLTCPTTSTSKTSSSAISTATGTSSANGTATATDASATATGSSSSGSGSGSSSSGSGSSSSDSADSSSSSAVAASGASAAKLGSSAFAAVAFIAAAFALL
ncbi:glucanbeta-glucosidase [Diaporthe eres]|uniref:Glucan 1,3-beta-glucosidase n=1 Tax=Diaporthe vaccinii TaxID=105482 RepID=A0ABR4E784_9PEZI|nr:glucanbeta-glucosidase [Diaporthe eres]